MLFRKCEGTVAASNSLMSTTAKHHTRQKDPSVASSETKPEERRKRRRVMFCEQTERVVTVCGCSDGADCVGERMEGQQRCESKQADPPESLLVRSASMWPEVSKSFWLDWRAGE